MMIDFLKPAFLTKNAELWTSDIESETNYGTLFRTSFRLEVAMFNAAFEDLQSKKQ
jgi:hypothetical protein